MCLYPRLIRNRKYLPNKKNGGNAPELKDNRVASVPIKCGKCIECMRAKSREWSIRLTEHIKTNVNGYFVTFTFSNESIIELSKNIETTGYERDNDIATQAVRYFLERYRKKYKTSINHWLVTELGHNGTENVHLHGLIFTDYIKDIPEIWKYGYVFIGDYVNNKTINYITKYVSKIDFQHKYYQPKILCSKGIGRNFTNSELAKNNKFKKEETREFYTFKNGTKSNLPVYYRNKLYNDDQREILWINLLDKKQRFVFGNKIDISKGIDQYTKYLQYYQKLNTRLGFGDDKKDWDKLEYENNLRDINWHKRTETDSNHINKQATNGIKANDIKKRKRKPKSDSL